MFRNYRPPVPDPAANANVEPAQDPGRHPLSDEELARLAPLFETLEDKDKIRLQLELLKKTTKASMPPPHVSVKSKTHMQLMKERLLPIGDHIMTKVEGRADWPQLEQKMWRYVCQLYWPMEGHEYPHLRAHEYYHNTKFFQKVRRDQEAKEKEEAALRDAARPVPERDTTVKDVAMQDAPMPDAAVTDTAMPDAAVPDASLVSPESPKETELDQTTLPVQKRVSYPKHLVDQFEQTAHLLCGYQNVSEDVTKVVTDIHNYPEKEARAILADIDVAEGFDAIQARIDKEERMELEHFQEQFNKEGEEENQKSMFGGLDGMDERSDHGRVFPWYKSDEIKNSEWAFCDSIRAGAGIEEPGSVATPRVPNPSLASDLSHMGSAEGNYDSI